MNVDIVNLDESTIKSINRFNLEINVTSQTMAFADEGFDPRNQNYAFAFDIQNLDCSMMLGVGNDEQIKMNSYLISQWNYLGHGQYMIFSNIMTYHHTDAEFNYKPKGLAYKTGDKIQINYNHITKLLEFRISSQQILYPCVYIYKPDDQVQLVEY